MTRFPYFSRFLCDKRIFLYMNTKLFCLLFPYMYEIIYTYSLIYKKTYGSLIKAAILVPILKKTLSSTQILKKNFARLIEPIKNNLFQLF